MLLAVKLKVALMAATVGALPIAGLQLPSNAGEPSSIQRPALVTLPASSVLYRAAGEFTRDGKPTMAPKTAVSIGKLAIMKHQVTAADYQVCVADGGCPRLADNSAAADRPVVKVSWRDAAAYAAWLSAKTGTQYRLPTDREWAYAAGSRYRDDAVAFDSSDPSKRWLARYQAESDRQPEHDDRELRPVGSFGANENGLLDIAGNVWEWTDTCYERTALDAGAAQPATVNCGVRVVEGQHRTYVTDFVRDARTGGCAAGIPPSNLGFRLVQEPQSWLRQMMSAVQAGGR